MHLRVHDLNWRSFLDHESATVRNSEDQEWLKCLRSRLDNLAQSSVRHMELITEVQSRSQVPLTVLERAYDIAQETGLEPALALEMVGCGVCVVELEEPLAVADETHSSNPPDWVTPPLEPNDVLILERRLRLTFRRLRTLLEQVGDLQGALNEFGRQPDVGPYDFRSSVF